MPVPLTDLTAQYRSIKGEIDAAITRTLESGGFILGPEVESLEREISAFCGTAHGVGVASGTDALHLALLACDIGPGDEVLTTPFTFIATAESIRKCGATPVFVDIEPDTCNMDPDKLHECVTPRTRAIVPVHLYGHPCDMTRLMEFASLHGLKVIEDCAQALGATWQGSRVGSFGHAGCLSFFPSKILGAYGDGGMVVCNDASVAERVRILRSHGSKKKYFHDVPGFNSRLDSLQASVLRTKLKHLEDWIERRRSLAATYARMLADVPGLGLPAEHAGARHVYNYYTVRINDERQAREALATHLKSRGIASAIYYPMSLHLQPVFAALGYGPGSFPVAETAQSQMLSLPMYPELAIQQVAAVVDAVRSFYGIPPTT